MARLKSSLAGLILTLLLIIVPVATMALALTPDDASLIFNAYSNAFYRVSGTNAVFKADQSGGVADFWEEAEEIECVIDVCDFTPNASHRAMTARLLNGFLKTHGADWSSNQYNDDCLWACIAFTRGFLTTGEPQFKAVARANFDMVYDRAWDRTLGGGLYWKTDNRSKNACVNGPGGIAACLLRQIYGDPSYEAKASNIFDWERKVLFDPETGAIYDSIDATGRIHGWTSTYNQGTFIGLANFLGRTNDAKMAADYTRDYLTHSGILEQYEIGGNNSGFNAIFLRWMTRFMRDHGLQHDYQSWLWDNAAAAWAVRRPDDGLSWCQWLTPTPPGTNLHSWDCISSLEAVQMALPPASDPRIIPNQTKK